ncbi:Swi1p Ecym_1398 [Eremothecium cymbalariae DBVPG|uniref:ARID domain-containing protein n=1 Tax=Eremothecium cymbalariae (strain CBS 270.75 / DBVPG 7215 / KCTC 17166 / NRRL Y-17582) TaxID=931890 RepID=G8JM57_ERECY|nr:hypothetical protein Ecym_1398 [Eremothecium cymbalariae DBVPG\
MEEQFVFADDNQQHQQQSDVPQRSLSSKEEYLNFFDPTPVQEDVSSQGAQNLTPQAILARSSLSNVNSPIFNSGIGNHGNSNMNEGTPDNISSLNAKRSDSNNTESTSYHNGVPSLSMSPSIFTPAVPSNISTGNGTVQRPPNSTPGAAPSPQQILSQQATPQALLGDISEDSNPVSQAPSSSKGNHVFADRAAMFAALQQRQQQRQQTSQQQLLLQRQQVQNQLQSQVQQEQSQMPQQQQQLLLQQQLPHNQRQKQQPQRLQLLKQQKQLFQEDQGTHSFVDPQQPILQQLQQQRSMLPRQQFPVQQPQQDVRQTIPSTQTMPPTQPSTQPSTPGASQATNQRQMLQNFEPEVQKRVSQELNGKQYELFVKYFMEHCKRCSIPFNPSPEICGIRVNLFILYMLVQRMGGAENVTRIQQWGNLAQKLQIYAPNSDEELSSYYYNTLMSYEKYLMTPDGMKETQTKRMILQQCLQETLRAVQQEQFEKKQVQPQVPTPVQSQLHPPQPRQQPLSINQPQTHPQPQSQTQPQPQSQSQPQPQLSQAPIVQHMIPQHHLHQAKMQSLREAQKLKQMKPRKPRVKKKTKKELEEERRRQEEAQRLRDLQLEKQRQEQKLLLEEQLREQQELLRERRKEQIRKLPKVYKRSMIRNYVPIKRPIEGQNGYDIKGLAQLGEKIDAVKPIFLFAPELGTINLHAITMALQSENNCEINTALNTLLVTSADNILRVPLKETPELLDTLCILACDKLHRLYKNDYHRKVTHDGIQKAYNVQELLSKPSSSCNHTYQAMDQILTAYKKQEDFPAEDAVIEVDSLTGIDISQYPITPMELPLDIGPDEEDIPVTKVDPPKFRRWSYIFDSLKSDGLKKDDELSVISYMAALRMVRNEVDTLFTDCHKRGAEDTHILFIDQLSTISMILRNLSFDDTNATAMANNVHVNRYIFELLWMLFTQMKKFIFHRKVLNLKKDSIIILSNLSHLLKLDNVVDGCMLLFLILSFGEPKEESQTNLRLTYPEYSMKIEKYRCYGVDVISKIMSLGYPNRSYIKSILLTNFDEETPESKVCLQVLRRYNGSHKFKLFNDVFSFISSTVPFRQLNQMPNLIEESVAIIFQAITASLALVKFINPSEETPFVENNLPYWWLTSEEYLGSSIRRLGEALSNMSAQNSNLKNLKPLFNLISPKCLELVRLLIEKSMQIASISPDREMNITVAKGIMGISNLFPSEPAAITVMMNPATDSDMAREMEQLYRLNKGILAKLQVSNLSGF